MRLLKNMGNACLNSYSFEQTTPNINCLVLQELCILPVSYMTVKDQRQISG